MKNLNYNIGNKKIKRIKKLQKKNNIWHMSYFIEI